MLRNFVAAERIQELVNDLEVALGYSHRTLGGFRRTPHHISSVGVGRKRHSCPQEPNTSCESRPDLKEVDY